MTLDVYTDLFDDIWTQSPMPECDNIREMRAKRGRTTGTGKRKTPEH